MTSGRGDAPAPSSVRRRPPCCSRFKLKLAHGLRRRLLPDRSRWRRLVADRPQRPRAGGRGAGSWSTCEPGQMSLSRGRRFHPTAIRRRRRWRRCGSQRPLAIMKHQVSVADYQRCVDDGACRALDRGVAAAAGPSRRAGELARRVGLCRLAVAQDRRALPAADRCTNGPSPPAANSGTTACRSTRRIRRRAGSAATNASPSSRPVDTDGARLRPLRRQ